jgi:hypothetical protein
MTKTKKPIKPPLYRRKWPWILGGVFVVTTLIGML